MKDHFKPGPVEGTIVAPVGINSRRDGVPYRGRVLVPADFVGKRVLVVAIAEPAQAAV